MENRRKANYFFVLRILLVIRVTAFLSFLCACVVRRAILEGVRSNTIFFTLSENDTSRILKPKGIPFDFLSFLEFCIVLQRTLDLVS